MQYSALLALSSALMAAGVTSERVAVPYGMNPSQAAAMGSAMNAPWAVPPPSAASMKHSKATIIPGMANSAMAYPSMAPMASPSFPSMPAMATPSPSSRVSHGPSRNGVNHKHSAHHGHDSFRAPQGGTHGVEQASNGWHDADGFSQGSNGVGNTAGMGQDPSNESQGNEGATPDESPRPEISGQGAQPQEPDSQNGSQEPAQPQGPPAVQQPQEDHTSEDPNQSQEQQPQAENPAPDANQAQAPQPPANDAPPSTDQDSTDSPSPENTDNTPSPPHGGLAPVSPMQPGSNVAPMGFDHKQHGEDVGNAFCLGQCYASEEEANCEAPYSSPSWKKERGCYTCCFTAPDI